MQQEDIEGAYNIGKELGYGRYGVVRLVQKRSYEHKRFALKSINKKVLVEGQLENEFEIMKGVDHPNIIKLYEMYADDNHYHLVTEFCGGGELFEHIIERGCLSE